MTNHEFFSDLEDDRPSLSMDERIVWISDNGPEYGNVRWLGKLPDLGREWMAGVEFDNPVGSGTGLYKDEQLFVTPLNHASLVPVIGLLKASDFGDTPQPPKRTSSVRLIDIDGENHTRAGGKSFDRTSDHSMYNRSSHGHLLPDLGERRTFSPSLVRGKMNEARDDRTSQTRIRYIPINLADKNAEITNTTSQNHDFSTSQRPILSAKPKKVAESIANENSSRNNISEVATLLDGTRLNDSHRKVEGIPIVPKPALNVSADETNPNEALKNMLGKSKGIQGNNNSCYLDATLFAMFSSTTLFDSLLYRPKSDADIPKYDQIQRILRDDIVKPLREDHFVGADHVMVLRTLLEQSSTVAGLTDEEKDPEEFLSLLLNQILKAEPYLKLSSGLESFLYQLIVDKDENVILPTVQDLVEQSFMSSTVRLREIPPCLLLQMPRFGRQYKMYSRIMPSLKLDVTDILEAVPRACGHRGKDCDNLAKYECNGCLKEKSGRNDTRLTSITYCNNCFQSKHFGKSHSTGIEDHDLTKTTLHKIPSEATSRYSNRYSTMKDKEIPRVYMELFAVLCIETSHYVCFVKCGYESDSPWCFFDSMADRKGEQNGYNIPEVSLFDEFLYWTSDKGVAYLLSHKDDKPLPEMARRLICDAYLCFYRYPGLLTYR